MHIQTETNWSPLVTDREVELGKLKYHDHMFISTEKSHYTAGEVVRGQLVLFTDSRIEASSLSIEFSNKVSIPKFSLFGSLRVFPHFSQKIKI